MVLVDVPWTPKPGTRHQKQERGYKRRERQYKKRNEGTKNGHDSTKTGTRVHLPKPPFYKTVFFSSGKKIAVRDFWTSDRRKRGSKHRFFRRLRGGLFSSRNRPPTCMKRGQYKTRPAGTWRNGMSTTPLSSGRTCSSWKKKTFCLKTHP